MPSVREIVDRSQIFFVSVLPQAAIAVTWSLDKAEKAFNWAKYCEEMHNTLFESGHLTELDEELLKLAQTNSKPTVFQRANLARAPLLLLEEFLRNPNLSEETMLVIMKAMSNVFPQSKFESICRQAIERKDLHQKAINMIQSSQDSETVSLMKAMILKEDLIRDLSPAVFEPKLDPLLKSVATTELLLTVLKLTSESETVPEAKLCERITRVLESSTKRWLGGVGRSQTISALLAVPVSLSRKLCEISPKNFLLSWLDILALLAGHLTPVYYAKDHVWSWPDDDEETDSRFRAMWFSFDQLVRHMQSLLSSSLNEDHVTLEAHKFLDRQKQLPGLCSIWLEVEQRLSINASN